MYKISFGAALVGNKILKVTNYPPNPKKIYPVIHQISGKKIVFLPICTLKSFLKIITNIQGGSKKVYDMI